MATKGPLGVIGYAVRMIAKLTQEAFMLPFAVNPIALRTEMTIKTASPWNTARAAPEPQSLDSPAEAETSVMKESRTSAHRSGLASPHCSRLR